MRNLIFAQHGHIFQSKDINKWLNNNWYYRNAYNPTHKVELPEVTDIEKANVEAIQREESIRK